MRIFIAMVLCVFATFVNADDPITYSPDGPQQFGGPGNCFVMHDVNWPDCVPPKRCAYTRGVPVSQSPSVKKINDTWYLVPSWYYECPNTARGVTDVAASVPSQLCVFVANAGSTNVSPSDFVCYTTTECDQEASESNTDHPTVKAMRKKWVRSDTGTEVLSEDDNSTGNWVDDTDIYAKNSNCTGDADHPLSSYPSGPIPIACNGVTCTANTP